MSPTDAVLHFIIQHEDIVNISEHSIDLSGITNQSIPVDIEAIGAGHSEVYANISDPTIE